MIELVSGLRHDVHWSIFKLIKLCSWEIDGETIEIRLVYCSFCTIVCWQFALVLTLIHLQGVEARV